MNGGAKERMEKRAQRGRWEVDRGRQTTGGGPAEGMDEGERVG